MKFVTPKTMTEFIAQENMLRSWGGDDDYEFKFEPLKKQNNNNNNENSNDSPKSQQNNSLSKKVINNLIFYLNIQGEGVRACLWRG